MTAAHTPEPRAAEPPPTAQRSMADLVRAAVSGWLGTALEFMDFQLYSLAAALVFSQLFFSGESPGMAVVLSMATYGVGYIARPLGAIFFGRLGDRIGRRKVLFYTIACGCCKDSGPAPRSAVQESCWPNTPPRSVAGSSPPWSALAPTAAPCSRRRSGPSCWA